MDDADEAALDEAAIDAATVDDAAAIGNFDAAAGWHNSESPDELAHIARVNMARHTLLVDPTRAAVLGNDDLLNLILSMLSFRALISFHGMASVSKTWLAAWRQAVQGWVATPADLRSRFLGPPVRTADFAFWMRFALQDAAEHARVLQTFSLAELHNLRASLGTVLEKMNGEGWVRFDLAGKSHHMQAVQDCGYTLSGEMTLRDRCHPEQAATLEREPTNPFDPNAIKVVVGAHHVGYLPRAVAAATTAQQHAAWTVPGAARLCMGEDGKAHVWCPRA